MRNRFSPYLWIAILSSLFFLPFLGGVHLFDWDEINFAELAREMLISKEYLRLQINFEPFWEKPPFFIWLQALSMHFFGVGEYAARFPNAICGIICLLVLYHIGKELYDKRFAWLWVGAYGGSILPHLYFKSGIIDPWLNLFIFLGIYYFVKFYWKKEGFASLKLSSNRWLYLFLAGFFVGLGILTKGPVAYLIAALTLFAYWLTQRLRLYINPLHVIVFTLASLLVTGSWYGIELLTNGSWFINEFIRYQYRLLSTPDAGHGGFPAYHVVVLLVGCFPASIFAIRAFSSLQQEHAYQHDFTLWMKCLFWVVLILFSIVKSKIVHYSSMCYFPLSFLAALSLYQMWEGKIVCKKWMQISLYAVGGLYVVACILMPILGLNIEWVKPLFQADLFALANLDAKPHWTGWEMIAGIWLLLVMTLGVRWMQMRKYKEASISLFGGTAVFVMLTLILFISKIEHYSQRAAITFYEELAGEDCYVTTYGYKSYAHLFYFQLPPPTNPKRSDYHWLMHGDIDKNVYIVTKIHKADQLRERKDIEELKEENGFVFFKRKGVKPSSKP